MNAHSTDLLLLIKLPAGEDGAVIDVLVHKTAHRTVDPKEIELVIEDTTVPRTIRRYTGVDEMPKVYEPRHIGPMSNFLSTHAFLVREVVEAGGARYGNLTIARTVLLMTEHGMNAADALASALDISTSLIRLQKQLDQKYQALLAQMN